MGDRFIVEELSSIQKGGAGHPQWHQGMMRSDDEVPLSVIVFQLGRYIFRIDSYSSTGPCLMAQWAVFLARTQEVSVFSQQFPFRRQLRSVGRGKQCVRSGMTCI